LTTRKSFDHHSPEHAADPVAAYRTLREGGAVERSDLYGGFTVLTRYADITAVGQDAERFSSALELPGGEGFGGGITVPHNPAATRMSVAEMDNPDWRRLRRRINPKFKPEPMAAFESRVEAITTACIDRIITMGECDLVFDICSPVPAIVTLEYLGLPTDEWQRYAVPIHTSTYTPRTPGHPAIERLMADFAWIFGRIREEIAERRRNPGGDDLIADFMAPDEEGTEFDDELVFEFIYAMLAAGVDTTTSLLSATFWFLDRHTDQRQKLIDDPALMTLAREEFLRYFTPAQATARTAVEEVALAGQDFQRGDRVLLPWASANRDPSQFDRPDEFVIDRKPNRHVAFGHGIHRCVGAPLARLEFDVIVREVLRRMPDYRIDRAAAKTYPDTGLMYGFERMPAVFTPGQPLAESATVHGG
jgi:cytochrome P450